MLIVSIDESSFRSDKLPNEAWQQDIHLGKRRRNIKEGVDKVIWRATKTRFKSFQAPFIANIQSNSLPEAAS